ncbi:MAG: hypothetical protein IRZ05_11915 [Micromonosporaceae bacterium]|jgi:hypothetical protein|nr:hypothetical protein [Micromonosporaceae bacterium]
MAQPDEEFIPEEHLAPEDRDFEVSDADALEQAAPVDPAADPVEVHRGLEVGEWDAIEQAHVVDLDDEYR